MSLKAIVTNRAALDVKYGPEGVAQILAAVDAMAQKDAARGVETRLLALDSPADMESVGGEAVVDTQDSRQTKNAVDAVWSHLTPDYLLLLGSPDVVPHQDLENPLYSPGRDDDELAPSDLPYACDAPYSVRVQDFTGPTRVVGRLPDRNGSNEPAHFVERILTAANHRQSPAATYLDYFAVCAREWQLVTTQSLENTFGSARNLRTSPEEGPVWPPDELARLSHYINCHGDTHDWHFYGNRPAFPVAHDAALAAESLREGTVVAAECCYGAELYAPGDGAGARPGIWDAYLTNKAYGFFGSSCLAYGPAIGVAGASQICRSFFFYIVEGASLGRAVLQARQDLIAAAPILDPIDLKTLAQFHLLGDPSIHPVDAGRADEAVPAVRAGPLRLRPLDAARRAAAGRSFRRQNLERMGAALAAVTSVAARTAAKKPPPRVRELLAQAARAARVTEPRFLTFRVDRPRAAGAMRTARRRSRAEPPRQVHVAIGVRGGKRSRRRQLVAVVALPDRDGVIVRRMFSR